eukprot:TRINITY_DN81310_c0_g1_i1.p1 TRINITY_DN81310_c0_g1~~TRINITY_DN81310_c0_g1_i1.p1  ORF type:complete len:902 (+),score=201.84 TRINITY_DN81310_c0_g1_i1:101-2806(+)
MRLRTFLGRTSTPSVQSLSSPARVVSRAVAASAIAAVMQACNLSRRSLSTATAAYVPSRAMARKASATAQHMSPWRAMAQLPAAQQRRAASNSVWTAAGESAFRSLARSSLAGSKAGSEHNGRIVFALAAAGLLSAVGTGRSRSGVAAQSSADGKESPPTLSWQQIAKLPRPGDQGIGVVKFLPDSSQVLYLKSADYGSLSRGLYATDVKTGATKPVACTPPGTGEEKDLSLEEKLRRERARIMNTGVTSYAIAGDGAGKILVPINGALYVREGVAEDATMTRLFDPQAAPLGPGPILDPQISKDGSLVCFVWQNEVYCVPTDGSAPPRALTTGAKEATVVHGLADFLAQEELDRYEGFWISPKGDYVAYEEVDEKHMPEFRIMHSGSDSVGPETQEDHRYPFAGEANPKVRFFVTPVSGGSGGPVEFDITGPFGPDCYLGRVQWMPDGALIVQILNREQTKLSVLRMDPKTRETQELFKEETDVWINIHDMLRPVGKEGKFLWASERTGFRHLYMYDPSNGSLTPMTSGNWIVEEINAIDEDANVVYFSGTSEKTWLDRHLFKVPLDGSGAVEQITKEPGLHGTVIDPKCKTFVDMYSNIGQPATATLRSLEKGALGSEVCSLFKNEDPLLAELQLQPPEFVTLPSTDGKVTLQAALYKPDPKVYGPGPYPTVVSCYGGPHVQFSQNAWRMTSDLRAQNMRRRGCLVLKVDNRGSFRRGLHFEAPVKHDMGSVEVDDQVAGVDWCVKQGMTDPKRVGIFGWSYGGYLSAMCLVKAGDTFKCAVAGAPVTHWDGYDTCYTERYMGTPQSNPEGYKRSAVMAHVDGLKGDLMLVHGLIDENVHFRHTARLINSLIAAEKPYQLLLFPNERHSPRSQKDRAYDEARIWAFIQNSLQIPVPAKL